MKSQLLIIEDDLADYATYKRLLKNEKQIFDDIIHKESPKDAITFLENNTPQCCILDYTFPDESAKDFINTLFNRFGNLRFPIVISTGQGDERLAVELMKMGVQDYLVKGGISSAELSRALKYALRTYSLQAQIHKMAQYDSLTGLLNRTLFMNRLAQAVTEARRYDHSVGLVCLDIDHFKQINDTYGHNVGDEVIKEIANRISTCVRDSDSIARFGGDEFTILLPNAKPHEGHFVAQKLLKEIPQPLYLKECILYVHPSIGLAHFPNTAANHHELLKQGDAALYKAKQQGRSQYVKFSQTYHDEWLRKNTLSVALPKALKENKLKLAYQPVFDVKSGAFKSVEALLRWEHENSHIPVEDVVELIHQGSLVLPYHLWLFNESLKQLQKWQKQKPGLKLALNISANLCHNRTIIDSLFDAAKENNIDPKSIILEVTETHLMRHQQLTREVLIELSKKGVLVAIDDFGTGYSSMEYLADLPCSQLKIDQRFFLNWEDNVKNQKIVEAITALGHQLELEVVAEGIENSFLANIVKKMGCDSAQGFWLGKPTLAQNNIQDFLISSKK